MKFLNLMALLIITGCASKRTKLKENDLTKEVQFEERVLSPYAADLSRL